jgi:hypothetical protein
MSLSDELRGRRGRGKAAPAGPVWAGPQADGPRGGVTYSLLNRYLGCKERFRCLVIEGLKPADAWNHRLGYGQMWHVCEQALAGKTEVVTAGGAPVRGGETWQANLYAYAQGQCDKYPLQQAEIGKWYGVCKTLFPLYAEYWSTHPDVTGRTPLLQEAVFDERYKLPSGRVVRLRGRWDSVDVIEGGELDAGVYLQENKTKGDVDEVQLRRQLTFDLQTMLYVTALSSYLPGRTGRAAGNLRGVRYNVVRRPRQYQGKKETEAEFLARLAGIVRENPQEFFMRWPVYVAPRDIKVFGQTCLAPLLENLCDDYEWWAYCKTQGKNPYDGIQRAWFGHTPRHYRYPFGVYDPLHEGGVTDLDEYLRTGSEVGLRRVDDLFPELQ